MGRRPCCDKIGLKKGPWTADEDQKLRCFIQANGTKYCWRAVPQRAGLLRCGKSCRLRWANYLRPDLKNDLLSEKEVKLVVDLHSQFGNKWSKIASHLPGRTDNYIKNYWHNHIKKKLSSMGVNSITHKPLFPHQNKSPKKLRRSREEIHDDETSLMEKSINNLDQLAMGNLTIDTEFSVDEIPLIQPHEIHIVIDTEFSVHEIPLIQPHEIRSIPPLSYHPPSNNCSPPSFPSTPSTSTTHISSSSINLINENL